jgi:quinol monooxygenase YgiN
MGGYVVMVEFRLKPGMSERFRRLISENARASVRDEPGCRQFDVVVPDGEPESIVLYEIYDDAAAFAAHMKTPHFAQFDRDSAALVASKKVTLGSLVFAGADG